ncbi:MAG: hypothetical protein HFI70_11610 [Lachnospiraceae bacterium]|nr:hypothetical protein [Lachnospiraceae bacterium]
MDIKLAISRSGHDKDNIYVIINEEANLVYLADGKLKPVEKPKRKNRKHIQIIKKLPKEITEVFTQENFRNEEVKRAIKLYQKSVEYQEETKCQKQM